jgi:hypothetical protein
MMPLHGKASSYASGYRNYKGPVRENDEHETMKLSWIPSGSIEDFSDIGKKIDLLDIERRKPLGQNFYLISHRLGSIDKDLKGPVDFTETSPHGEFFFSQSLIDNFNAKPRCQLFEMFQDLPGLHIDPPRPGYGQYSADSSRTS